MAQVDVFSPNDRFQLGFVADVQVRNKLFDIHFVKYKPHGTENYIRMVLMESR
jgi:hypothetical protein